VAPASSRCLILASALGSPGRVKAPACPMTLPGAARIPPMRAEIGLFQIC
jgi:hypothetical protein